MNGIVHDFAERLEYSMELSDESAWVEFYKRFFGDQLLLCARVDANSKLQHVGVDRLVVLKNRELPIYVDEKKRGKDYGDFLVEEWSVFYCENHTNNKLGWCLDDRKVSDFVAYAIVEAGRVHMLPYLVLRNVCRRCLPAWKKLPHAYPKDALNAGYRTRNCAVPWDELYRQIEREVRDRKFGSELPLPSSRKLGDQLEFGWGVKV